MAQRKSHPQHKIPTSRLILVLIKCNRQQFSDSHAHMGNPYKTRTGLKRLRSSLGYSLAGFCAAYKHEAAFRQEVLLAAILIPLAIWLPVGNVSKALMIASVLLVVVVELLNSAIEATVDRISLDSHDLAKRAKDIGSAAVLISLINALAVWGLVLTAA